MRTLTISATSRTAGQGTGAAHEYRALPQLELRQEPGQQLKIRGYAAVFNVLSEGLSFKERVLPGAFKSSLQNDVRALVGHNSSQIIGRRKNRSLELREDQKGLYVEIQPPDTSVGRDALEVVRRGDVDQMSFGFETVLDRWKTENKELVRELLEVNLHEVSLVAFPAYPQTSVTVRSTCSPARELVQELERWCGPLSSKQQAVVVQNRDERGKMEYSDLKNETPPLELKESGVTEVVRDFRTGQLTVVYTTGRRETRSMPISAGLVTVPRSRYRRILEEVEARSRAFERREQLLLAEARQAARRPLTAGERWKMILAAEERAGMTHSTEVEPLTDYEMKLYSDTIITRPDDYYQRLDERNKQELRKVLTKRDNARRRQEQAKEQAEDRLYGPQRELARLRELQAEEESRVYGF